MTSRNVSDVIVEHVDSVINYLCAAAEARRCSFEFQKVFRSDSNCRNNKKLKQNLIIDEMNTIPRTKDRIVFDVGVYANNHRRQVQKRSSSLPRSPYLP